MSKHQDKSPNISRDEPTQPDPWETEEELSPEVMKLKTAIDLAQLAFQRVSSLDNYQSRLCAYFCLATWFAGQIDPHPYLTVTGPKNTGKTSILRAFGSMACNPIMATFCEVISRKRSQPNDRYTIVVDDVDEALADPESNIPVKFSKWVRQGSSRVPVYDEPIKPAGGIVVVYRFGLRCTSYPLISIAAGGHSITVRTVRDTNRTYMDHHQLEPVFRKVRELAAQVRSYIALPKDVKPPKGIGVAGYGLETYRSFVAMAQVINDWDFASKVWDRIGSPIKRWITKNF